MTYLSAVALGGLWLTLDPYLRGAVRILTARATLWDVHGSEACRSVDLDKQSWVDAMPNSRGLKPQRDAELTTTPWMAKDKHPASSKQATLEKYAEPGEADNYKWRCRLRDPERRAAR